MIIDYYLHSIMDGNLFKNLIVGVDAVSLIGGIFGYYKKNYKLLLGFIILALVFQYFGLIMVLIV